MPELTWFCGHANQHVTTVFSSSTECILLLVSELIINLKLVFFIVTSQKFISGCISIPSWSLILTKMCMVRSVIQEVGLKALEHSCILMPVLLALLKDASPPVAKHSIIAITSFFCSVLEELALQVCLLHRWSWVLTKEIACLVFVLLSFWEINTCLHWNVSWQL